MQFFVRHRSKVFTVLGIAAPIAAAVASGGVLTAPVIITAVGVFFSKLAASPLSHDAERNADIQARLERIKNRGDQP
jgi:hypothetical protein